MLVGISFRTLPHKSPPVVVVVMVVVVVGVVVLVFIFIVFVVVVVVVVSTLVVVSLVVLLVVIVVVVFAMASSSISMTHGSEMTSRLHIANALVFGNLNDRMKWMVVSGFIVTQHKKSVKDIDLQLHLI